MAYSWEAFGWFITIVFIWCCVWPRSWISLAVWQLTQRVQHQAAAQSEQVEPSTPYLDRAVCLKQKVGTHGTRKLVKQHSRPELPKPFALLQTWQQGHRRPQQQIPQSPQQLSSPCVQARDIFQFLLKKCDWVRDYRPYCKMFLPWIQNTDLSIYRTKAVSVSVSAGRHQSPNCLIAF